VRRPRLPTRPQAEIDLHGCIAPEAEAKTLAFLDRARATRLTLVRIITGKGLHSEEGPVLPGLVDQLLRLEKKNGAIASFTWEGERGIPAGSVLVRL